MLALHTDRIALDLEPVGDSLSGGQIVGRWSWSCEWIVRRGQNHFW